MRRVILLTYDRDKNIKFFTGFYNSLKEKGHKILRVFHIGTPKEQTESCCEWGNFDFTAIEDFEPERIIVFNGYAPETSGAINYLKNRYKIFFVEQGWFPQKGNIYIDHQGLGGRSSLATSDLSSSAVNSKRVENAIAELREKHYNFANPELGEYVLVPLQLNNDTSIALDSPYFKTMQSLMSFVAREFKGQKVIVAKHPLMPSEPMNKSLEYSSKPTAQLAQYAKAVIGINSTSMIESLVHYKPVGFLGHSVISASGVSYAPELTLNFPKNVSRFNPGKTRIEYTIFNLLKKQFPINEVPENIIKQIEV